MIRLGRELIQRYLRHYLSTGVLLAASAAWAQSNFVSFINLSEHIVAPGQTYVTANADDIEVSGSPAVIRVRSPRYNCYFAGAGGSNLAVGTYTNCIRYPFNGSSPGLDFTNPSVFWACTTDCGSFQVKELHVDDNGQVDRLWITFTNFCNESNPPTLVETVGEIRYHSQLAELATLYLNCPSNVTATTPFGHNSMVVTYPAPDGTPGAWIDSYPRSGSVFSAGTNTVTTTLTYGTNVLTCTSTVTVQVEPFTFALLQSFPSGELLIPAGGNLHLGVTAKTDAFDSIASVTFLSSTNVLAVANALPAYSSTEGFLGYYAQYDWYNVPAGYYSFQAIAQNSSGVRGTSAVLNVTVPVNLVKNGGFETGDFTHWDLEGTTASPAGDYNTVPPSWTTTLVRHSEVFGAYLGDIQVASLSQTLSTFPGQSYLVSLWLDNPVSGTNQFFGINWNSNSAASNAVINIFNPPAFSWTKLQSLVLATDTNTILQIRAENDPGYFGLDDIFVTPVPTPKLELAGISESHFRLSWPTAPGVAYKLQYKTNLLQANWSDLIPAFIATGDSSTILDTNSVDAPQRFYRLTFP